ncbi:ERBB-3 BINDING PROTEIN 1-like isoform X1 [Silene latifolia]|uniref:ERBB-3 BINDING PROTEIN 1-like isoform X1 n=1 Tax=Silene latifolia TaxID=37657 RepID=UPI003D77CB5E
MRVDEAEFEENEVYAIDILASTGEGKPRMLDGKQTNIYKSVKVSLSDRALEEKRARLGLVECVTHDLLHPYPVLHEKNGRII